MKTEQAQRASLVFRYARALTISSLIIVFFMLSGCTYRYVDTTIALQRFPVGSSAADAETAWRVSWGFEPHPLMADEQLWVIKSVDFMRGMKVVDGNATEDWIRILDNMAVAGMFVPYVEGGSRFKDVFTYYTGLSQLHANATTRRAFSPSYIHGRRIIRETNDDFVRWIETGSGGYHANARLKRGQVMILWGMFSAYNYVYPMVFRFRDDGVIQVRIAASGQNLRADPIAAYSHLHMGAWRFEPHLCAIDNGACIPEDVEIELVSRRVVGSQEEIVYEPFNSGTEGGAAWSAEEFTSILFSNPNQPNGRPIECDSGDSELCVSDAPIGYSLVPIRYGSARYKASTDEDFLDNDIWVTKKPTAPGLAELLFTEVHDYADGESLAGERKVIWHKSAYNHLPRFEDLGFGQNNSFNSNRGVALTNYTGFDLIPRNLLFVTPTYTPKPQSD